jgi:putative aldouronate transport system permease protein
MMRLGLLNTLGSVIFPLAINVYNLVLMRNFFEGIPGSLFEAAQIDGCSPMGIFFRIVLPLSKAAIASIGLMFMVTFWNDYTNFKIYVTNNALFNFQIKLRNMVMDSDIPDDGGVPANTIKNAATIVAILPFMILYPILQDYFVQGVNVGAVKE